MGGREGVFVLRKAGTPPGTLPASHACRAASNSDKSIREDAGPYRSLRDSSKKGLKGRPMGDLSGPQTRTSRIRAVPVRVTAAGPRAAPPQHRLSCRAPNIPLPSCESADYSTFLSRPTSGGSFRRGRPWIGWQMGTRVRGWKQATGRPGRLLRAGPAVRGGRRSPGDGRAPETDPSPSPFRVHTREWNPW